MTSSLVGSEMCIRDSARTCGISSMAGVAMLSGAGSIGLDTGRPRAEHGAVSYTHLTLPTICSV
eukprot:3208221-Prorocentrum_lima.AAC.1